MTGGFAAVFPLDGTTTTLLPDPRTGSTSTKTGSAVHWGFPLQYSTFYLTDRFTGAPPKEEPLHQFVPLIEFAFDSPLQRHSGLKAAATANRGLSYVGDTWQLAAEAIVPMNRAAGHGLGFRVQLLLFLDDLVPTVFGSPLFTR